MRLSGENPETSVWISTTDLMSGLLVIFLFLSILMTQETDKAKEKLEIAQNKIHTVTNQANLAEENIKEAINKNFNYYDRSKYALNEDGLASARFPDASGTFNEGSYVLTEKFKDELNYFLPRYLKAISESDPKYVKEIRIEGHASSEWNSVVPITKEEAYTKNMELSQQRTLSILLYALKRPELAPYRQLMQDKMRAVGYSSSNVIYNSDGYEDRVASRRIEFRVIANDAATLEDIKNALKQ
jgi:outer membrane protein OmpA-like peptidoglycan-associated protein